MKKLKLQLDNLGDVVVLTREQLKNVNGSGPADSLCAAPGQPCDQHSGCCSLNSYCVDHGGIVACSLP